MTRPPRAGGRRTERVPRSDPPFGGTDPPKRRRARLALVRVASPAAPANDRRGGRGRRDLELRLAPSTPSPSRRQARKDRARRKRPADRRTRTSAAVAQEEARAPSS